MTDRIVNDFAWRIGGQSGEGIDSTGSIFALACARAGLHLYTFRSFPSRIRGGLTFYETRVNAKPVRCRPDKVDYVVALGQEVIDATVDELVDGAVLIYDSDAFQPDLSEVKVKLHAYPVPMTKLAEASGNKIMRNMVALGATAWLVEMDLGIFYEFVEERFGKKGEKIVAMNKAVLKAGYDHVAQHFQKHDPYTLQRIALPKRRMVIAGAAATGFGALAGGCRFLAAYPITPATDVMEWMIDHVDEFGGHVVQAEDEICAANMVLGAGWAGVRAMTSTSGPGFSLMAEAISLAATAEIPAVFVDVMRPGPSTGLPTKHEQGDLMYALHAGHGEAPRILLSPSSIEEAFTMAAEAFNFAEEYQCPVFFLIDQDLSISSQTLEKDLDPTKVEVRRGKIVTPAELAAIPQESFRRYAFTDDGISPRALAGTPNGLSLSTGSEHNDRGTVTESKTNRTKMMDKRFRKLDTFRERVRGGTHTFGPQDARVGIVSWGSTRWIIEEAAARLERDGVRTKRLVVTHLWPLPEDAIRAFLESVDVAIFVEQNKTGQLATLVRQVLGFHGTIRQLNKYDGTPMKPSEVYHGVKDLLEERAPKGGVPAAPRAARAQEVA